MDTKQKVLAAIFIELIILIITIVACAWVKYTETAFQRYILICVGAWAIMLSCKFILYLNKKF